jgi:hypothetical protein
MKKSTAESIETANRSFKTLIAGLSSRTFALLAMVVLGGALGTYFLAASHAATSVSSVEPENGTIASPATVQNDSTASGGKSVKFGITGGGGNPDCTPLAHIPAGFPNNCTTGYKNAPDYPGSLHSCGSIQSNTTYNFCDFSGGAFVGSSSNALTNVTFHGCRFHGTQVEGVLVAVFGDNITFDYSSFEPDVAFVPNTQVAYNKSYQYGISADGSYGSHVAKLTVTNSDFWGFGNAIDTAGSTQAKPQVFRGNWIHDAANDGGSYHTDGIGTLSGSGTGSYVVIDNNTIESPGNTNGIAFQQGSYNHFTVTNNLIGGWGYSVALWAPSTYTTFTGNTFSTRLKPVFGPLYDDTFASSTGSIWKNNKWYVPAGAAYGNPADNGKFWTPNGPSSTDYQ